MEEVDLDRLRGLLIMLANCDTAPANRLMAIAELEAIGRRIEHADRFRWVCRSGAGIAGEGVTHVTISTG